MRPIIISSGSQEWSSNSPLPTDRKERKPKVEKQRRETINKWLAKLLSLIRQFDAKEGRSSSDNNAKVEKKVILERSAIMLEQLFAKENAGHPESYNRGFNDCVSETQRILQTIPGIDPSIQESIMYQLKQKSPIKFKHSINVSCLLQGPQNPINLPISVIEPDESMADENVQETSSTYQTMPQAKSSLRQTLRHFNPGRTPLATLDTNTMKVGSLSKNALKPSKRPHADTNYVLHNNYNDNYNNNYNDNYNNNYNYDNNNNNNSNILQSGTCWRPW